MSDPGIPFRVFCADHDEHRARYLDRRPLLDDSCALCLLAVAGERLRKVQASEKVLREGLDRVTPLPSYLANAGLWARHLLADARAAGEKGQPE